MDSDQSALTIAAGPQNNRAVHFSGGGGGGMNCGTRITGQLQQPTTSLHTWPNTWDIKGCLCLFKQHNPKHTTDW